MWFDNRLYRVYKHSTGCQTRLTTGLTTGCVMYTIGCQTGCTTRFGNRLNEQSVRLTRLSNRLSNRFDSQLYRVNGVSWMTLTTDRKENGLRCTTTVTGCAAEDWAPETQTESACTDYGQQNCHGKHGHHLHKIQATRFSTDMESRAVSLQWQLSVMFTQAESCAKHYVPTKSTSQQ